MNDRFKFRVFYKKENRYLGEYDIPPTIMQNGNLAYLDDKAMKNYTIEQCTGLKDRNGKLIYEGDIVTNMTPDGRLTTENDQEFIKEIISFKGCFGILGKTNFYPLIEYVDFHQGDYIANELKVIGNIHENPDLLKE